MQAEISSVARYSLRKGLRAWDLVFDGAPAVLRHEQGIVYVAWLLGHPSVEPVHALQVIANTHSVSNAIRKSVEISAPAVSTPHARIQERALGMDDLESIRLLRRKERELEAILASEDEAEPVKAEALRELDQIARQQRHHWRRSEDHAQKSVRAVRRAIIRFYSRLQKATNPEGGPHPVLGPFAEHLDRHLLIPSARYSGLRGSFARSGRVGCFIYEPPAGVIWEV